MNRTIKAALLAVVLALCGGIFSLGVLAEEYGRPDTVRLARIASEAALHWPDVGAGDYRPYGYDFSAVDMSGRLLYRTSPDTALSQEDALQRYDNILNVTVEGRIVGALFINTGFYRKLQTLREQDALFLFSAFVFLAVLFFLYSLYLERTVIRPFHKMRDFARRIAYGNLDVPLSMEKNNLFGAFTEAFDLMRTQLREARELERQASQSKKELVASLSHDIKTPVTSIKLLSELMLVNRQDGPDRKRLQTIYGKAEQIDLLITDLFHSSLEDLNEMQVAPAVLESRRIVELISSSDYEGKTDCGPVPDCLILADPLRLEQVIGNLIMNSYKYAKTRIQITSGLENGMLKVLFRDFGPGVAHEDLPHLTTKFYRGANATSQPQNGAGLGLYISARIMEKSGGSLACRNCDGGFLVELLFPLA